MLAECLVFARIVHFQKFSTLRVNCFLHFRPTPVPTEADEIIGGHDAGITTQAPIVTTLVENPTIEACSL